MITDEMLYEACAELNDAMLKSLPGPHECMHQFSRRFERKMKRLIYKVDHPIQYQVIQRVASIILVILIGFMSILVCSPTARAYFFGWVQEKYEFFTAYYFPEVNSENNTNGEYYIANLPPEFTEVASSSDDSKFTRIYANEDGTMLLFSYLPSHKHRVFYLSEDAYIVESVSISGCVADLYLSDNPNRNNGIIWCDEEKEIIFYIAGSFPKEEIIQFAENVSEKTNK